MNTERAGRPSESEAKRHPRLRVITPESCMGRDEGESLDAESGSGPDRIRGADSRLVEIRSPSMSSRDSESCRLPRHPSRWGAQARVPIVGGTAARSLRGSLAEFEIMRCACRRWLSAHLNPAKTRIGIQDEVSNFTGRQGDIGERTLDCLSLTNRSFFEIRR